MKSLVEVLEGFYGTVAGGSLFCEPATKKKFIKMGSMIMSLYVFPTFISSNIPINIVKEILNLKLFAKSRINWKSSSSGAHEKSYVSIYTFQQMKDAFAELIKRGKCKEEIKVLREIYKYVQAHQSIANREALGTMIALIFSLAVLERDRFIELPQNPTLDDIFKIANKGNQDDMDYISDLVYHHKYDRIFNYSDNWFERLLPVEEQDS